MIGSAFGYPFVLLWRRAGLIAPWLIGCWLILFTIDVVSTVFGVDVVFGDFSEQAAYNFVGSFPVLFTTGALFAAALIDLGERKADRPPGFGDGAIYFVCGLIWFALVLLPVGLACASLVSAAQAFAPAQWAPWSLYGVGAVASLGAVLVLARMAFQTPVSIAQGRALGFSAWSESRGKTFKIIVSLLVLWTVGAALS